MARMDSMKLRISQSTVTETSDGSVLCSADIPSDGRFDESLTDVLAKDMTEFSSDGSFHVSSDVRFNESVDGSSGHSSDDISDCPSDRSFDDHSDNSSISLCDDSSRCSDDSSECEFGDSFASDGAFDASFSCSRNNSVIVENDDEQGQASKEHTSSPKKLVVSSTIPETDSMPIRRLHSGGSLRSMTSSESSPQKGSNRKNEIWRSTPNIKLGRCESGGVLIGSPRRVDSSRSVQSSLQPTSTHSSNNSSRSLSQHLSRHETSKNNTYIDDERSVASQEIRRLAFSVNNFYSPKKSGISQRRLPRGESLRSIQPLPLSTSSHERIGSISANNLLSMQKDATTENDQGANMLKSRLQQKPEVTSIPIRGLRRGGSLRTINQQTCGTMKNEQWASMPKSRIRKTEGPPAASCGLPRTGGSLTSLDAFNHSLGPKSNHQTGASMKNEKWASMPKSRIRKSEGPAIRASGLQREGSLRSLSSIHNNSYHSPRSTIRTYQTGTTMKNEQWASMPKSRIRKSVIPSAPVEGLQRAESEGPAIRAMGLQRESSLRSLSSYHNISNHSPASTMRTHQTGKNEQWASMPKSRIRKSEVPSTPVGGLQRVGSLRTISSLQQISNHCRGSVLSQQTGATMKNEQWASMPKSRIRKSHVSGTPTRGLQKVVSMSSLYNDSNANTRGRPMHRDKPTLTPGPRI